MSEQDVLASGEDWSVYLDKESGKLVCSFNNEMAESNLSDSEGMIAYCEQCDRFFEGLRSGDESLS